MRQRHLARDGGDVHDGAALLLQQLRQRKAREQDGGAQVHVDDAPQLVGARVGDGAAVVVAGVVHQHVDRTRGLDRPVHQGAGLVQVCHVRRNGEGALPDLLRDGFEGGGSPVVGLFAMDDFHVL